MASCPKYKKATVVKTSTSHTQHVQVSKTQKTRKSLAFTTPKIVLICS